MNIKKSQLTFTLTVQYKLRIESLTFQSLPKYFDEFIYEYDLVTETLGLGHSSAFENFVLIKK